MHFQFFHWEKQRQEISPRILWFLWQSRRQYPFLALFTHSTALLSRKGPQVSAHSLPFRCSPAQACPPHFRKIKWSSSSPAWESRNLQPPALLSNQATFLPTQTGKKNESIILCSPPNSSKPNPRVTQANSWSGNDLVNSGRALRYRRDSLQTWIPMIKSFRGTRVYKPRDLCRTEGRMRVSYEEKFKGSLVTLK